MTACKTESTFKTGFDAEFDSFSWHDNHIHGIAFQNPDGNYDFDLVFDIDHILEWIKTPDGHFEFMIAPTNLIFHDVANLVIDLKLGYKQHLEISDIERTEIVTEHGRKMFRWQIDTPTNNKISFEATGFTQTLRKPPIRKRRQWLDECER